MKVSSTKFVLEEFLCATCRHSKLCNICQIYSGDGEEHEEEIRIGGFGRLLDLSKNGQLENTRDKSCEAERAQKEQTMT